jgi:hypothetical protein
VDVGVIFGVDVFQFRMERGIAGTGQAGISFGDESAAQRSAGVDIFTEADVLDPDPIQLVQHF